MNDSMDAAASRTIELLEHRLDHVRSLLSCDDRMECDLQHVMDHGKNSTVLARLSTIQSRLSQLSEKSPVVRRLLQLCGCLSARLLPSREIIAYSFHDGEDSMHPDLFHPTTSDLPPTSLTTSEILSIINSCATSYQTTASCLTSIKDVPIPPAEESATLMALHPRMAQLELLQESQAKEMAELRSRSASTIQRWYELGVLAGGECWTEWEGRVANVEKVVRQEEMHRAKEMESAEAYRS